MQFIPRLLTHIYISSPHRISSGFPEVGEFLLDSVKRRIQENTPFTIEKDYWQALALLMEADEMAKNPVVIFNGKTLRTLEEDIENIRFIAAKLMR